MPITNDFPHIFEPIQVGPLRLKNRFVCSPIVSAHAHPLTGDVTDGLVAFVGAEAKTGAGLVTIGSTPVDFDRGRDFYGCMSVTRESDIPQLKRVADEAHRWGAKISAEIMHAGRIAYPPELHGKKALVPWLEPDMDPDFYEEINKEQMAQVIQNFRNAARRLQAAGFDMCMIHAAHGNLLSAFFSGVYNKRTDEYGGSLENRMRFLKELCAGVREEVGPRFGIDLRISSNEFVEGSPSLDDIAALLNELSVSINTAHLSGGLIFDPTKEIYMMPTYYQERSLNAERAAYIRSKVNIPITVVGNIPNMAAAEEILAEGKADMVAMARNVLADFDIVKKAYRNEADDVRQCIHCCECTRLPAIGAEVRCAVNPFAGKESRFPCVKPAEKKKKVMIVGGGPAGMQAAQICTARGHEVKLYEASDRLGGRFHEAAALSYKDYHRTYLAWDIKTTMNCGAEIIFNTTVTPELVEAEAPDALIIACGGVHILPKSIPGIEKAATITDIESGKGKPGKRVVFCGGGVTSAECGIGLGEEGHEVTLVDMSSYENIHKDVFANVKAAIKYKMDDCGMVFVGEAAVKEICDDCVKAEKNGEIIEIPCDTAVASFGLRPNSAVIDSLSNLVYETYLVGDADHIGNVLNANQTAFGVCIEL